MVENLNIQKVLAPISLTTRVKKASREKNRNQHKSFDEELREKKKKRKEKSMDKQKTEKEKQLDQEGSLNDKHNNTESPNSKQGRLIDLRI
jgi:hypothetical protein